MRRRTLLGGALAAGGLAAVPGLTACGGGGGSGGGMTVTLGDNFSDAVPGKALHATVGAFEKDSGLKVKWNSSDHEAFQQAINAYLQGNPDDVIPWFAGYRMQFFAKKGLLTDVEDVWGDIDGDYTDAFKQASKGLDGKRYFVPFYYYPWAVFYRKSLFDQKGYTIPKTLAEFTDLAKAMQGDGLAPLGFADREGWPAMGTFDAINFRTNGYDFHMKLMRGEASWESDEVKATFDAWAKLLPYHQEGSLGRDWTVTADGLLKKKVGMYYLGMFVGQPFTKPEDKADLDFFPFPEINPDHGQDTIEAPIDGFMLSKKPKEPEGAKKLLKWLGSAAGQEAYLAVDPNNVAASSKADTSKYNELQKKAVEVVQATKNITQFLDRDTNPDFASTVMIPTMQKFIAKPGDINSILAGVESQKKSIFAK